MRSPVRSVGENLVHNDWSRCVRGQANEVEISAPRAKVFSN